MYCIAPFMKDLRACCEHSWMEHHCPSPWSGCPLPAVENTFSWEILERGSYRCTPGSRQMCVCPCCLQLHWPHGGLYFFVQNPWDILFSHFLRSLCLFSTIPFIFSKINNSICLHLVSLCSFKFSVVPLSWYLFHIFNCADTFKLVKSCFASLARFAGETLQDSWTPVSEKGYLFLFHFHWPQHLPDLWPASSEQPIRQFFTVSSAVLR